MTTTIESIKYNWQNNLKMRYSGKIIYQNDEFITIEARFQHESFEAFGMTFNKNDRFVELYSYIHWFNIMEIHDRHTDDIKGWYANVSRPAKLTGKGIEWVDLELDLMVFPDSRQLVLDEDEFEEILLSEEDTKQARRAVDHLKRIIVPGKLPELATIKSANILN